jgi:pimeloyl-ACP methyl ester carboxylesterase
MFTKIGYDVLRFDYFGTGDSAGECDEGGLSHWHDDVIAAAEELKAVASVERISLVGLRLGGVLASGVELAGLHRLVLWDPVVNGRDFIREMLQTDQQLSHYAMGMTGESPEAVAVAPMPGQVVGIMGYPLTVSLREELEGINLLKLDRVAAERVYLLASSLKPEYESLKSQLESICRRTEFHCIPSPGNWCEVDSFGSLLLPQAIMAGVVNCFK